MKIVNKQVHHPVPPTTFTLEMTAVELAAIRLATGGVGGNGLFQQAAAKVYTTLADIKTGDVYGMVFSGALDARYDGDEAFKKIVKRAQELEIVSGR